MPQKCTAGYTRRDWLRQAAAVCTVGLGAESAAGTQGSLSDDDDRFLDELERANYLYFWEQASPQT
jgi:hypothetical protein